ncbi:MAG: 3-oxoacyl-[acyl-carrier-protein] synthase III C-terminal domain-containing protein [Microcoleaceae cyanobacterium]
MIANSIFSDGAVGFMVLPESLRHLISQPQIEILDVCTNFIPGQEIYMDENVFVLGDGVSKVVPLKVVDSVINPLLNRNKLRLSEIEEWSIHQGGKTVLSQFGKSEILGLTEEQLKTSFESFYEYGNFSTPSCFFVLKKFFKRQYLEPKSNILGAIVGFGAGYYLGAGLYRWN